VKKVFIFIFKLILAAAFLCLVVVTSAFVAMAVGSGGTSEQGEPEAIIVLGAHITVDGPTPILEKRLDAAAAYIKTHPGITVVCSGGQGSNEPRAEAASMAEYLAEKGVPEETILREDKSRNTYQNVLFSRQLLGYDVKHVLIVSNGFHLTRAKFLAERAGFECVSTLSSEDTKESVPLLMLLREPLAIIKSFCFDGLDRVVTSVLFA